MLVSSSPPPPNISLHRIRIAIQPSTLPLSLHPSLLYTSVRVKDEEDIFHSSLSTSSTDSEGGGGNEDTTSMPYIKSEDTRIYVAGSLPSLPAIPSLQVQSSSLSCSLTQQVIPKVESLLTPCALPRPSAPRHFILTLTKSLDAALTFYMYQRLSQYDTSLPSPYGIQVTSLEQKPHVYIIRPSKDDPTVIHQIFALVVDTVRQYNAPLTTSVVTAADTLFYHFSRVYSSTPFQLNSKEKRGQKTTPSQKPKQEEKAKLELQPPSVPLFACSAQHVSTRPTQWLRQSLELSCFVVTDSRALRYLCCRSSVNARNVPLFRVSTTLASDGDQTHVLTVPM